MQPPPVMPLADQPLEFATRYNHDDPNMKSSYPYVDPVGPIRGMDTAAAAPSMNNWTAMPYAPIPPVPPPGSQVLIQHVMVLTFSSKAFIKC